MGYNSKIYKINGGVTNETNVKNLYRMTGLKLKTTLDCVTKTLSKLFLDQQEDVLETFET